MIEDLNIYNNHTIENVEIQIDSSIKEELCTHTNHEGQIVVHCSYTAIGYFDAIRIWPTTQLTAIDNKSSSKLLFAENIKPFPHWTEVQENKTKRFTLIFAPLPKTCEVFHFEEIIPEPGAFKVENIKRNEQDIYYIDLN